MSAYDTHEKVWNPPMPLLFQWHWRLEDRPLSAAAIRRQDVAEALAFRHRLPGRKM